ncbi:MAG TPA: formylmethanofuran dehydrogenase subunit B [Pirellulales bacterium]|nr:formylmethanofuran dehydrogenase subunit B [Pirellulales bacterium]
MTHSSAPAKPTAAQVPNALCTACACACDDIVVSVENNAIIAAEHACPRGRAWFLDTSLGAEPAATVDGRPVELAEAVARAASILSEARAPLIYGLGETTTEAQRVAIALADRLGGTVDTPTSRTQGPVGMALHGVGEMTSTLGEVRNRGDLIVFWGCDPATTHPRHFERYSLDCPGMFVPAGRADRRCVVVDTERTATAERADWFIALRPDSDFDALWTLRAVIAGLPLDAATVERQTGVPLADWDRLAAALRAAKFGVVLYDGKLASRTGRHLNVEALLALVRDMNAHTRCVCNALRSGGNQAGAESALLWQTGFPFGVNFARGYPRYNPGEFTAEALLERREVDTVLVVAGDPLTELGARAAAQLRRVPLVCIDCRDTPTRRSAQVAIATAPYGIAVGGTVYRMDDVPLPLRPALGSPLPNDEDVLRVILGAIGPSGSR